MSKAALLHGDSLQILPTLKPSSVDAIVTDPPYGLNFMGKAWDHGVPSAEYWSECLRVLKPGGHLLAFGGTRTFHRLACAIEDAGFELRDTLMWVYGSGFPKSRNIATDLQGSELASKYEGWGTALKPAYEPIIMARKFPEGTIANNVKLYGVGGLNIDECRLPLNGDYKCKANGRPSQTGLSDNYDPANANQPDTVGRWPANLIHDGSDEVIELFPDAPGQLAATGKRKQGSVYGTVTDGVVGVEGRKDSITSAARFFYCAKATKKDRGEGNNHPTVKPTELMRYLIKLVTHENAIVLDPFMGSGSTGKAALLESRRFIGIDREKEYVDIAKSRVI